MSFRTGMLGETILLRQSDLAVVGPANSLLNGNAQPDGVFHWIMDASTVYGDGTLFLVNENGVMACIDRATARPGPRGTWPMHWAAPSSCSPSTRRPGTSSPPTGMGCRPSPRPRRAGAEGTRQDIRKRINPSPVSTPRGRRT